MTPDPSTGQILPGSKFGDKLTELAREAKVIVEIGTWKGMGSTYCLMQGMRKPDQFMITIEANALMWECCPWNNPRVWRIWGTIVRPEELPLYEHFDDTTARRLSYEEDRHAMSSAPFCLPIIPFEIDLLLLDGGEWSSNLEYWKLKGRCRIIALDDTDEVKSIKNYRARRDMLDHNWTVLADEPKDRYGWFIARKT